MSNSSRVACGSFYILKPIGKGRAQTYQCAYYLAICASLMDESICFEKQKGSLRNEK